MKVTTLSASPPRIGAAAPIVTEAVIVGAGPCGLFQVFELGLLGISAHVVDSLKHPGGQCAELYPDKPIYDIPALPVCGAQELVDRLLQQIKPFKAQLHLGHEVTEFARRADGRFHLATAGGISAAMLRGARITLSPSPPGPPRIASQRPSRSLTRSCLAAGMSANRRAR